MASASLVVREVWYFSHSDSTWRRERGLRFSRLAERVSKQYAQWAGVAMLGLDGLEELWVWGLWAWMNKGEMQREKDLCE